MASQLEIVTPPCADLDDGGGRARAGPARPRGRGRADRAPDERGRASDGARAGRLDRRPALPAHARRLRRARATPDVCGLHLHVSLGGADRTLAVYNALRSHLPELAALAANAPFHDQRDTGLASIRPVIAVNLRRQGVPPAIPSWEWFANSLAWGAASNTVPDTRRWWFELRLHATYGTLELRVPDAQASVADVHGVAAFAFGLVEALAARYDAGEPLPVHDSWRIDENRWSAMRDGVGRHARGPRHRRARADAGAAALPRPRPASGDRAAASRPTAPSAPGRPGWMAPLRHLADQFLS